MTGIPRLEVRTDLKSRDFIVDKEQGLEVMASEVVANYNELAERVEKYESYLHALAWDYIAQRQLLEGKEGKLYTLLGLT